MIVVVDVDVADQGGRIGIGGAHDVRYDALKPARFERSRRYHMLSKQSQPTKPRDGWISFVLENNSPDCRANGSYRYKQPDLNG